MLRRIIGPKTNEELGSREDYIARNIMISTPHQIYGCKYYKVGTDLLASPEGLLHGVCFCLYEGWNFNSGNYLFTTDTK